MVARSQPQLNQPRCLAGLGQVSTCGGRVLIGLIYVAGNPKCPVRPVTEGQAKSEATTQLEDLCTHSFVLAQVVWQYCSTRDFPYSCVKSRTTLPCSLPCSILSKTSLSRDIGSTVNRVLTTPRAAMSCCSETVSMALALNRDLRIFAHVPWFRWHPCDFQLRFLGY